MLYVLACKVCKRCKHETVAYPGLLQPLLIPSQAWESMSMDFVEALPKLEVKNCIFVVVDRFTKFSHFLSLTYPYTAQKVARILLDQVVEMHSVPKMIVSDREKIFTSLMQQALWKALGSKLNLSTVYHLQTDGETKRVNQRLKTYLRCLCFENPRSWHKWLSVAQWHNGGIIPATTVPSGGPLSRFSLATNHPCYQPSRDPQVQQQWTSTYSSDSRSQQLKKDLAMAQNYMKQLTNKGRSEKEFEVGEEVGLT